ncbi:hypothetical protein QOZ80_9BG0712830 [Eleusine coracana subsp. coracana]|nr:hypothetical protein QOZ80_9BG0712830 [Eleusine coracana subsp. coracana]
MQYMVSLLPHAKKDNKVESKQSKGVTLNELVELRSCSSCLFFECRKQKNLYLWMIMSLGGPEGFVYVHLYEQIWVEAATSRLCRRLLVTQEEMGDKTSDIERLECVFNDASAKPIKISYTALKSVTKNFVQVIGRGGFGVVYLGQLRNGMVAVKKLSINLMDLSDKMFLDEVTNLMNLKHKNIVRFLGYCADSHGEIIEHRIVETPQRLLCFEYVPNGSLQRYLKDKSYGFEWNVRYQIIQGIYFGISRCFDGNKSSMFTENLIGTLGFIAPELIEKGHISSKTDIYSLGVILITLLSGSNDINYDNWRELLNEDCPQMKTCIEIAQCCVEKDPKKRPTIIEIVEKLNEMGPMIDDTATDINEPRNDPECSLYQDVEKFRELSTQTVGEYSRNFSRGSISSFAAYRSPLPLDIFSCSIPPSSDKDELHLTDGVSYNYNGRPLSATALKALVEKKPELATSLETGKTEQLTPNGGFDLSPAVSPSGKRVAVANFSGNRWTGEIEHLKTDIVVMNVDRKAQGRMDRKVLIRDSGWPSWGSDNIIFFHRGSTNVDPDSGMLITAWRVFRYDLYTNQTCLVTPEDISAMTPAAINETKVAVATIRKRATRGMSGHQREEQQYRHIEIFDLASPNNPPIKITQNINPQADFYNPFVLDGGRRIGYHRVRRSDDMSRRQDGYGNVLRHFHKMQSPQKDLGLLRVSGMSPTISSDGSKLAFIDKFSSVWLADKHGLRLVWERSGGGPTNSSVLSAAWNQNPDKDILYICVGPPFKISSAVEIYAISNASGSHPETKRLTDGGFNNAFPSSNPDGTKLVFRSNRGQTSEGGGAGLRQMNLYIMEDAHAAGGEGDETYKDDGTAVKRLTQGPWIDTHCQWSPRGDWIVFSSNRDKPNSAPFQGDMLGLDHYAIYLVMAADPSVVVRVIASGLAGSYNAGRVNHPVFSPDGRSIAFTSDLAGVPAEPISMSMLARTARTYDNVFFVDIDPHDISKNRDIRRFQRVTHSRYEYSMPAWTKFAADEPNHLWNICW